MNKTLKTILPTIVLLFFGNFVFGNYGANKGCQWSCSG